MDGLELVAAMVSPSDGSMVISSEKLDEGSMSSIDGFSSGSNGFDFGIAFLGTSDPVEFSLRVRRLDTHNACMS